jgi:hypothetical protein
MLFKKKKNEITKDSSKAPPPRAPRYSSIAHVRINGFDGKAALRNISTGGFCMESRTYAAIQIGECYRMWIQPEISANIKAFELEVEVRWVQSSETNFTAGFLIVSAPPNSPYEKYIDHVKTTLSAPGSQGAGY